MAIVKPTNKIYAGGAERVSEVLKVETATSMYPGRLVVKGTNDDDIVVAGASAGKAFVKVIGILGYDGTPDQYKPATVDTIYAADDWAEVLSGPGIIVVGSLADGETVVKGDLLVPAASGEVALLAPTDLNATFADTEVEADLAASFDVVAKAWESKAASGSSEDILMMLLR